MEIHPEGKITDPRNRWVEELDLDAAIQASGLLPENKELIGRFVRDARIGKTILKGSKKRIGKARLVKYLQDIKKLDIFFQKPLNEVTQEEMERFILELEEGHIKQTNGKPYAIETQVAIKKIIIKFYKWICRSKKDAPPIVDWIDTSYTIKDYPTLSEAEVENLLRLMLSNTPQELTRNRAIVAVLFDAGARIDELLNVRLKHVSFDNDNYKIRIEFSKTKARTLVVARCKKYLDEWLDIHPMRTSTEAQLFPITQTAVAKMITRAGNRIGKKLTPHGLRHASATYWAANLTAYQMNYRFGWSMNSKQPARYIDRSGINQDVIAETIETASRTQLQSQNDQLNRRVAQLEEQLDRLLQMDKAEIRKIIAKMQENDTS